MCGTFNDGNIVNCFNNRIDTIKEKKKMNTCGKKIEVNGETYVLEGSTQMANNYYIIRTYSAGVFAGEIVSRNDKEVELKNARRLWQWYGAASLSQLSQEGVNEPDKCKFPCEVKSIILTEAIEIIACTKDAQSSIKSVPVWKK